MVVGLGRQQGLVARVLGAVALAWLVSVAVPARADIIPLSEMEHGTKASPAQCAARPDAVWVMAYGQGFCIRYYLSNAGGEGRSPVVFLQGDKLGVFNRKTMTWSQPGTSDFNTESFMKMADKLSMSSHTTAIYLARMGIDGSSGFHGDRKTNLELAVTNAALDAIKRRYRFAELNLVGQSGGSMLIGGLLAQRQDIGCAVPGSGRLTLDKNETSGAPSANPAARPVDASEDVPLIAQNHSARILLVTDPLDERAPGQVNFVRQLRQAGRPVDQLFVQAIDAEHHGVVRYSFMVVSECVRGTDSRDIAAKLRTLVQETVGRTAAAAAHAGPTTFR